MFDAAGTHLLGLPATERFDGFGILIVSDPGTVPLRR